MSWVQIPLPAQGEIMNNIIAECTECKENVPIDHVICNNCRSSIVNIVVELTSALVNEVSNSKNPSERTIRTLKHVKNEFNVRTGQLKEILDKHR